MHVHFLFSTRIGIAIGPRTWFGDKFGDDVSFSGTVLDNIFSGAFSYAIAISSARNFTVENNVLLGNTSFIGSRGPNCSDSDNTPDPAAFVMDTSTTTSSTTQSDFEIIPDGNSLTCVLPPDGGDYWPFGGNPSNATSTSTSSGSESTSSGQTSTTASGASSSGSTVGIVVGVIVGVVVIGVGSWLLRRWALKRAETNKHFADTRRSSYVKQL